MAEIIGLDGSLLGQAAEAKIERGQAKATVQTQIERPKTWTAETPNLYSVRIGLRQGGGPSTC